MQGQVIIGPDFFRKERNNYSKWTFSFFRELFQNSIDAGARNININISRNTDGQKQQGTFVSFKDDGCGMTTDTLKNVYFCLGETTKNDTSTIGGYGKARILTCFSHFSYGIKTLDNEVEGSGSTYILKNGKSYVPGCIVSVDVDERDEYGNENIVEALARYLSLSQMNCAVNFIVDNSEMPCPKPLYRRQEARKLSFGRVYVNKSSFHKDTLVVRVNGVPMFTRALAADALVILEIDQDKSRDVLVSNRDSLNSVYENELDYFLQEIAIDARSALRTTKPRTLILGDSSNACITVNHDLTSHVPQIHDSTVESIASAAKINNNILTNPGNIKEVFPENIQENYNIDYDFSKMYDTKHPAWILHIDNDVPMTRKAAWLWNPYRNNNYGNTKRKTGLIWSVAVQHAIKIWLEIQKEQSVSWLPGFVFSDEVEGMHAAKGNVHRVMLCPITKDGKHCFSLSNKDDRMRIAMIAAHEVTHFTHRLHDERFATLCFEITHKIMCNFKAVSKEMSEVIKVACEVV